MEPPSDRTDPAQSSLINLDRLPNGAEIAGVDIEWIDDSSGVIEGQLVVEIDGRYPDTTDVLPHLTAPVAGESEYWLAYLESGFVEAFVDVGGAHRDPTAVSFADETGQHWLRRCAPQLHHEWDDYATMVVTVVDDAGEQEAVLSLPSARRLIARHYNYEATMQDDDHPDPVVLIEAEPADRTVWGPARISSDVGHELEPVLDPTIQMDIPDQWLVEVDAAEYASETPVWEPAAGPDPWDEDAVEQWLADIDDDFGEYTITDNADDDAAPTAYERLSAIRDQLTDVTIPELFDDPSDSDEVETDSQPSTHSDGRTSTSDDDSTTSTDTDTTERDRRGGRRRHGIGGRRRRRTRAAGSADAESDQ